jgi:hypothetical protein
MHTAVRAALDSGDFNTLCGFVSPNSNFTDCGSLQLYLDALRDTGRV